MDNGETLLLLIASSLAGVISGTLTGLIPGIHPNNIASLLITLAALSSVASAEHELLISAFLLSASVTHTFLSFIPSAFIGAPEGETALSVLPAHTMLLQGRAYEAVVLSAAGSFFAVIFAFAFLLPFKLMLFLYSYVSDFTLYVLIGISLLLILSESIKSMEPVEAVIASSFVFILSGVFGYFISNMNLSSPVFASSSNALFPALTGLFGLSTVIFSLLHTPEIPAQKTEKTRIKISSAMKSAFVGSSSGMFVSFIPGVTAAHATVIAMLARKNRSPEHVILTLSAVNTANTIFCMATLFILIEARSGVAIALQKILPITQWNGFIPPYNLSLLLISVIIASSAAYFLTIKLGKHFSTMLEHISYRHFLMITALIITALVFVLSGTLGILILAVATSIGIVPITLGVRRSNCMGVLLLNIIFYLLQQ